MQAKVGMVRDRVQKMLTKIVGRLEVDQAGDFSFGYESTRVFVEVSPFGDFAVVNVYAITNFELQPSEDLYRYVATNAGAWVFGHLGANESDGSVQVVFRHTLLADFLDPAELRAAVGAVATTAAELDNVIKDKFGGRIISDL